MSTEPIFNTSAVTAATAQNSIVIDENDDDSFSGAANSVSETISIGSHTSSSSLRYSYTINSTNSEQVAPDIGHGSSAFDIIDSDRKSVSSTASLLSVVAAGTDIDTNHSKQRKSSYVRSMAKRFEEITDPQQTNHEANFNECNWWLKSPSVTYLEDDVLCNVDKNDKFISDFSDNCDIKNEQYDLQTDVNAKEQIEGVKSRIFRLNQLSNSADNLSKKHYSNKGISNSNYRYFIYKLHGIFITRVKKPSHTFITKDNRF